MNNTNQNNLVFLLFFVKKIIYFPFKEDFVNLFPGIGQSSLYDKLLSPHYYHMPSKNSSEEMLIPYYNYDSLILYNSPASFSSSFSLYLSENPLFLPPTPHMSINIEKTCLYGFV